MYKPERRAGLPDFVSSESINLVELSRCQRYQLNHELDNDKHGVVNDSYGDQKASNLFFAPINPNGLDLELVEGLEIDLRQGHVSAGGYFIQETLERILCDDDLVDFVDVRANLKRHVPSYLDRWYHVR